MRSKWKGPNTSRRLLGNCLKEKTTLVLALGGRNRIFKTNRRVLNNIASINTFSRNSLILLSFIGLKFFIHNGNTFIKTEINQQMVGHKLGEFAFTRKHSPPKKKKLKKKIAFKIKKEK